jgi:hypothetical protein
MDIKSKTPDPESVSENDWVERHQADPRFPTDPDFVEVGALCERYQTSAPEIMQLARIHPGSCLCSDGNPWVDHGAEDRTLFFHEPTLQAALNTAL